MPKETGSPLNNPSPQRNAAAIASSNKVKTTRDSDSKGVREGVTKGGRERVKPAEAILRCEMCGRRQKIVFSAGRVPQWHRCIGCGELQPVDGYHVVVYGLSLPRVLSDSEVKARMVEREAHRR